MIGRTSSFSFRDKDTPLHEVAIKLGVSHVVTGSVRRQQDQLRISAQLNRTSDNRQLWSDTFDGKTEDLFDLQEKIAQAVIRNFKITLSGALADNLADAGTASIEAYEIYLQYLKGGNGYTKAMSLLNRAIELDPQFARAYASRADLNLMVAQGIEVDLDEQWRLVELDANKALEIDPTIGQAYGALGFMNYLQRNFVAMEPYYKAGLEADPKDPRLLYTYLMSLISVGRLTEADSIVDRLLSVEPNIHWYVLYKGFIAYALGDYTLAKELAIKSSTMGRNTYQQITGWLAARDGDNTTAAADLAQAWKGWGTGLTYEQMVQVFQGVYGTEDQRRQAVQLMNEVRKQRTPSAQNRLLPNFYMLLGERETALEMFYNKADPMDEVFYGRFWMGIGEYLEFRQSEAFQNFTHRTGLLEYWKTYGWPDFCRPKPSDKPNDFKCS